MSVSRSSRKVLNAALVLTATLAVLAVVVFGARADKQSDSTEVAKPAVTMVLAVEQQGRQLTAIASGSGTIVSEDGSILTNYHVIGDARSRVLHELFVVARLRSPTSEPELVCAGRPNFGKLKPELDLALIKCDLDMSLRPYQAAKWPTVPVGRSEEMIPGERVVVLGYPAVGGMRIQETRGLLSGWMAEEQGSSLRAYMKTDAAIFQGNSGGAALNEDGELIGVPTAYRVTTAEIGEVVLSAGKQGLIRPIEHARDLLAVATEGWTPSSDTEVPETNGAKPARSSGVRITSTVLDGATGKPVEGAFVIVLKPGFGREQIDIEELEAQALTWGQTTAAGDFQLEKPLARGQSYTVAVLTRGYEPRVADGALVIGESAPSVLDPWKIIRIDRR